VSLSRETVRTAPWALAAFAAWAMFVRGPYHFDDFVTPLDDPASQGVGAFFGHLTTTLRPLTKLTFALEASAGLGDMPWARRLFSCMVHGVGVGLLLALVRGEVARARARTALPALAVAAYALHPIHAEAILALAGRPSLLASTLLFGALLAVQRRRDHMGAALFFLACMARETAIVGLLPLLVLARREGGLGRTVPQIAAFFCAIPIYVLNARMATLGRYSLSVVETSEGVPLARQWAAIPVGLSLWARPGALSVDHGEALPDSPWAPLALLGLAILGGAALLTLAALVKPAFARTSLPLVAALLLAALAPTQSFVFKVDALTERPFAFALACVPLAVAGLATATTRVHPALRSAVSFAALSAAVVAGLGLRGRGPLYASEVALWADAAAKSDTNPRPYVNWIVSLEEVGRSDEAQRATRLARAKFPWDRALRLTEETYREAAEAQKEESR
jgi:protein O-mannosyl-transferase